MSYNPPDADDFGGGWLGAQAYTQPDSEGFTASWLATSGGTGSYTPPTADNFSGGWVGAGPYTVPSLSDFSAAWTPPPDGGGGDGAAAGFWVTKFGLPRGGEPRVVTSFQPAAFGTPAGANRYVPESFSAAQFGTPATPTFTLAPVPSFGSTSFGVAYGYIPFSFGAPSISCAASGWRTTAWSQPVATINTTHDASGFAAAQFGTAQTTASFTVQNFSVSPSFGTATVRLRLRASTTPVLQFGLPVSGRGFFAQPTNRTRFGKAKASFPGARVARGWTRSVFGRPRGRIVAASGMSTSGAFAQFGGATCSVLYRAGSGYEGAHFGRPVVRRTPAC
jgi:hypothetical protein